MCNLSEYVEEKGIKQGMAEEKQNRIIRMLGKKKFSYEEIADIFEISVAEVTEIENKLLVSA